MLWFLVLHIMALVFWIAALLYLPALIASHSGRGSSMIVRSNPHNSIERFVFTRIATPAALLAIIAGTLVFVVDRTVDGWLILKLTAVTALVLCHVLIGLLVLRMERGGEKPLRGWCLAAGAVLCCLLVLILWLVLAKPMLELPL
ncbi:CopD family protein [Halopseudomonas xiamenensis]|uniref:CopD family protein n=1 Tax=Halopseudomonas xiamenensis TaxID=157792 RepID=UPI001629E1B4|nr:CopD family protein [Halopseudomonas xiamenensis]